MYKYETHLHTWPVSKCASKTVRETLEFYKSAGYEGVFITNHFLDGNINIDNDVPYEEKINFYFSDYEDAVKMSEQIGIKAFFGAEMSYNGTDFLVYGLDKNWYLKHPQIMEMKKSELLPYLMDEGALVIHAHPFREAGYIDHIRLFPRCVHGVEIINGCRTDFENDRAKEYADNYGLLYFAGSDNHSGANQRTLTGVSFDTPIKDESDFVNRIKNNQMGIFVTDNS